MEDTCKGKECWFYLLIKDLTHSSSEVLDFKNCPFYQEMIFTPTPIGGKVESAKTIKDCTNKRSLLILLEEVYPRMLGVQKSNEEMRNSTENASEIMSDFIKIASRLKEKNVIEHDKNTAQLESEI